MAYGIFKAFNNYSDLTKLERNCKNRYEALKQPPIEKSWWSSQKSVDHQDFCFKIES
jgi:hypothetical protein